MNEPSQGEATACMKPALLVRVAGDIPETLSPVFKGN